MNRVEQVLKYMNVTLSCHSECEDETAVKRRRINKKRVNCGTVLHDTKPVINASQIYINITKYEGIFSKHNGMENSCS